jgi:ABC-type transport system substrate-binding protein
VKRKTASSIILQLIFISMLMLAFNIRQLHPVFEGKAEATLPIFVEQNKVALETGATYQWLDPHVSYYQYDYWTLWHSVETLFWYEKANATKIIPWLVESYTASSDNLHYNLTLRQGITFQDGTPFNATAVWFSLNRLLIIDGTSGDGLNHGSQAAWILQQLLDQSLSSALSGEAQAHDAAWVQAVLDQNFVEIIDNYKVRLNLLTPSTQFLPIMAGPWASIVSPTSTIRMDYQHLGLGTWDGDFNHYFEHMAGNGETGLNLPQNGWKIGTGPYYLESVEPTTPYRIVLKAYGNYWGGPNDMNLPPAGKTRIATIEFRTIASFTTRLLDLTAGTATGIAVPTASIFQVVDRNKWIGEGILESIVPGVTMHGPFPQFSSWWLDFNINVTRPDGRLRDWQPFADWRIRMAVSCSVNMTDMNINVNNRLGIVADNIVPPGTFPPGSYNPDVGPTFSFNLTRAEELLNASRDDPLTSFTYYNGTAVPPGIVDNSFGPSFAFGKTVEFYVQSGADQFQQVLTTMADNLNAIAIENDLGIKFSVIIVPGGQQYTLASSHSIDSYMGGWIADYNHVLNWLTPMYLSTGTYFSWNLWNLTRLDTLYDEALAADHAGDLDELLRVNDEMNTVANEALTYMVWWYPTLQFARSTWLKGWYVNSVYGVDLWSTMYYEAPSDVTPPVTTISLEGVLGENDWFTSDVTVTLSATDDYQVEKTEYSFDNATWIPYATPFNVSEEGHLVIYYKSTDATGNKETIKTITGKIDKAAPTGAIAINNDVAYTTSTYITLALTSADATSGVYQLRLSNDGAWDTEQWETPSSAKAWTLASGDGQKTVYYQIKDRAGLISTTYSDTITLDVTPPSGSVTMAAGSAYMNTTSVTLTLSAGDATSGVVQMRLSHDNTTWTPWEAYSTSKSWTLSTGDGEQTVYVQYTDAAGLVSESCSDTIILDTTAPAITITSPGLGYEIKSSTVRVTWTCSDESSGTSHCEIRLDEDSWINVGANTVHTFSAVNDGTHTVDVKAYDQAGLSRMDSVEFFVNTSPQLGLGYIEMVAIGAIIIIAVIAVAAYLLKFRK